MDSILNGADSDKAGRLLTYRRDAAFILCFKYPLERGYKLSDLQLRDIKAFQGFLDKVARMTVQQVNNQFARKPDHADAWEGFQVYHYAVTDAFRIHVINEAGRFKILRFDPNHGVHRG